MNISATMRAAGRRAALGVATLAVALAATIPAASAASVDEIVKRGSVRIGVLSGVPIYGTVDEAGNPAGYDIDVARTLAGYMGVKVELVPLTPPARIPALQAGKVDFLVATLAATPERAKAVMFTAPYSAFQMVIFANKSAPLATLADLNGKRIGVNRGSSQETALARANVPGLQIVRYQDDSTVVQALIAHQVDAAALPDGVAKDVMKQQANANLAIKFGFFNQPNAMAVRLEETEMRDWLNKSIVKMTGSGELNKISLKWTGNPLPDLAKP
ncbi:transporter substrate-binding domain-containing protein [Pseudoduganella namucuonensis]|uniref:Amino acid ABC transporter substrate-binding protein, PAAT family n=1 Tax=Pseudoduganella namucuonensis TaxID=1035707 RepID=A0A1I7LTD9_9BURK|nr:transporter substrate-binding domain-containing protein [Pseudoduganella namucuonensis]SFV12966.1 amino acid ABC transporter substrate-binding protein, PAAT family [Pseudoduganella namucuonensis]